MDHFDLRSGELWCEDVPLKAIAEGAGTPVYVYSTATMVRHAEVMQAEVAGCGGGEPLVAYAVKANPNPAVLATLARAGLGADVVSIGEYAKARASGVPAERIVFSGVGKTEAEMAAALAGGLLQFNVESVEEARTLSAVASSMGAVAPMGFRINPNVAAGTHAKITTGTADNKFGIAATEALDAYREAASLPGLQITGITLHIGSQLMSLAPLEAAFVRL
ncbi:MAG TPA: alanine racemase, partial [Sphingomicrobium sp.]|nr:alanine racemase [Sphingomicrobium sp.]